MYVFRWRKKVVFEQNRGSDEVFTTQIWCNSAGSDVIPSLVIYTAESVNSLWRFDGASENMYRCTDSWWISEEISID